MTRLAEIESHIGNMVELREIVGAMRSLASMRVQEAQHTLPGIRSYAQTMATGIGAALLLMPEPRATFGREQGRQALVLCTAEHGFVGAFNEHLLDAARASIAAGDLLFILGTRGGAAAEGRDWATAWAQSMATRPAGVPETIRALTAELYRRIGAGDVAQVAVMFARHRQTSGMTIERRLLLPVDPASLAPARWRQPPLHNLSPDDLLQKLIADYVFALLTEAAVESLASENAARFAAMQSAHDNVARKVEELRQEARQARQTEITAELLDLVTGVEAQKA
jgi:F-type H+-transporting ATPase subunit gamma